MPTPEMPTTVSSFSGRSSPEGVALRCAPDGVVERVVVHNLSGAEIAGSLSASVDDGSIASCRLFLRSLLRGGLARSTPMRLGTRDVHCFGIGNAVIGVIDPLTAAAFAESVEGFETLAAAIRRTDDTYQLYEDLARANNELVTAQRELARSVAELQRLNAYKDELLGMAAHDLRNPLSANAAFIAFLLEDSAGFSANDHMLLDRLRSNSEYMLRLVDSALDFAAIQSGHVRLQLEDSNVDELTASVVETMRIIADAKRVGILYAAGATLPRMALDQVKISQSIQNLIANAVQYSPDDATVEVRVSASGSGVAIEVEDHGPGIPPEELPGLFKAYTRLSTVNLTKQRSAGLGLAITRRMVEAHGGTIDVRSEVGKGSLFVLRLR